MGDPFRAMSEPAKLAVDGLSIASLVGVLANFLPALASILTILWTLIRIYETKTVQRLLGRPRVEETEG